jgi:hypothetical protein
MIRMATKAKIVRSIACSAAGISLSRPNEFNPNSINNINDVLRPSARRPAGIPAHTVTQNMAALYRIDGAKSWMSRAKTK